MLNRHILPTFRAVPLREITTPQVRRRRTDLLDAGVGPATVSKAYQVLRAIMNTAVDDGLIERDPCRVKGARTVTRTERPFLTAAPSVTSTSTISGTLAAPSPRPAAPPRVS